MAKISSSVLNLRVGIEDILPSSSEFVALNDLANAYLPKAVELTPPNQDYKNFLDEQSSHLDIALTHYMQPEVSQNSLLIPTNFIQNMQYAKNALQNMAEHEANPCLQDALAVLEEDSELQNILQVYRSMLLQG